MSTESSFDELHPDVEDEEQHLAVGDRISYFCTRAKFAAVWSRKKIEIELNKDKICKIQYLSIGEKKQAYFEERKNWDDEFRRYFHTLIPFGSEEFNFKIFPNHFDSYPHVHDAIGQQLYKLHFSFTTARDFNERFPYSEDFQRAPCVAVAELCLIHSALHGYHQALCSIAFHLLSGTLSTKPNREHALAILTSPHLHDNFIALNLRAMSYSIGGVFQPEEIMMWMENGVRTSEKLTFQERIEHSDILDELKADLAFFKMWTPGFHAVNWEEVLPLLLHNGDKKSLYILGWMTLHGLGELKQNIQRGFLSLHRSVDKGSAIACILIASKYVGASHDVETIFDYVARSYTSSEELESYAEHIQFQESVTKDITPKMLENRKKSSTSQKILSVIINSLDFLGTIKCFGVLRETQNIHQAKGIFNKSVEFKKLISSEHQHPLNRLIVSTQNAVQFSCPYFPLDIVEIVLEYLMSMNVGLKIGIV